MAFHDAVTVGDLGDSGSKFLNFLVLEKVRSKSRGNENTNFVVGLQSRSHLLVCHALNDFSSSSVCVLIDELLGGIDGKLQRSGVINPGLGILGILVTVIIAFRNTTIVFFTNKSFLDVVLSTVFI